MSYPFRRLLREVSLTLCFSPIFHTPNAGSRDPAYSNWVEHAVGRVPSRGAVSAFLSTVAGAGNRWRARSGFNLASTADQTVVAWPCSADLQLFAICRVAEFHSAGTAISNAPESFNSVPISNGREQERSAAIRVPRAHGSVQSST